MSAPAKVVGQVVGAANPFTSFKELTDGVTNVVLPYVTLVSEQTTGNIVRDPSLAFYMTLLFMFSLIIVIVSDRVNLTRNLRVAMIEAHLVFLKMLRGIITVGLFMVGKRIGASGGFLSGLTEATPFIETTTSTWLLQKTIEWFVQVNPAATYSAQTFVPVVNDQGLLHTIFMVVYDYLQTYNTTVLASLTGDLTPTWGTSTALVFSDVSGDKSNGATTAGNVRTLYQLYNSSASPLASTNGARVTGGFDQSATWYYSPLFIGVVVGMF